MSNPPVHLSGHVHSTHGVVFKVGVESGDTRFAIFDGKVKWEVHNGISWQPFVLNLPEMPLLPFLSQSRRRDLLIACAAYYTSLFTGGPAMPRIAEYNVERDTYVSPLANLADAAKLRQFIIELLEPV